MSVKPRVLHIVSDSYVAERNARTGGSKGIAIFSDYLTSRDIDYDEIAAPQRSDAKLSGS